MTADQKSFAVKMGFFGHYNEPELEVNVPRSAFTNGTCRLHLVFDPVKKQWETASAGSTELKINTPARIINEKKEVKARAPVLKVPEKKEAPKRSASGSSGSSRLDRLSAPKKIVEKHEVSTSASSIKN